MLFKFFFKLTMPLLMFLISQSSEHDDNEEQETLYMQVEQLYEGACSSVQIEGVKLEECTVNSCWQEGQIIIWLQNQATARELPVRDWIIVHFHTLPYCYTMQKRENGKHFKVYSKIK